MTKKRRQIDAGALAAAAVPQPDPVEKATTPPPPRPEFVREPPPVAKAPEPSPKKTGRAGKVQIQGYFPKETRRELKALAAQLDRTVEDLLAEAIADVLAKHGANQG